MNYTPHEVSPRLRRRSTFRVWSKDQEEQLLQCEQLVQPETVTGKSKQQQLLERWESLGYHGFTPDELLKKCSSVHRIRDMLRPESLDAGSNVTAKLGLRKGSLLEDAAWEEETLYMVRSGKTGDFKERLRTDRRASSVADAQNRTALHHACSAGNMNMITMLLENSAILDAQDNDHRTPLYFALQHGWDEVVEFLLEKGADPCHTDVRGVTPLHLAAYSNSRRSTRLLLAQKGVDPNAQDEKGCSPMHLAAHRASTDVVEMLLAAGGDASLPDKRGNLAIALAERMDKKANARVLKSFKTAATAVLAGVKMQMAIARANSPPRNRDSNTKSG
eukprot:Hpha_TRINITY_DN16008_c3_g2::TRINITY_DN16008_c3_g2_i1::g.120519::m.120519/K06694/PSMD10; 26S proteasome non-ATPase regulatory subunit 10